MYLGSGLHKRSLFQEYMLTFVHACMVVLGHTATGNTNALHQNS